MNVTKKNFREILPEVNECIEKANFFSLDCEFTGLYTENNITPFDYPREAFKKICDNSSGFILIQFGLTAVWVSKENPEKFIYRTFNFYVFPRFWKSSFRCQSSSLSFLAERGFDFSKLFCEGISYCNINEENVLRERLLEKQQQREETKNSDKKETPNYIPVPLEEKDYIENVSEIIKEFISSNEKKTVIDDCNGFQRKLIYEMIEQRFNDDIFASTQVTENNIKIIVIEHKKSEEEKELLEEERRRNEQQELEDSIGMSTVLKKISNSKKLIIGHNMLLDIIFILRQFFQPIPEDFKEFKKLVRSTFPYLIDTKYLCTSSTFKPLIKSNILTNLIQIVTEKPFSLPCIESETPEYGHLIEETKMHEAGYDSFVTTLVFLAMTKFLNIPPEKVSNNCAELTEYFNRIHLCKVQDVNYINLSGKEPCPSRDHVFHINIPGTWKNNDIMNQFRNYGPINIIWINSTEALVSLYNKENSKIVLKTIGKYGDFKIQSYMDYKKSLENYSHASEEEKKEDSIQNRKRKQNSTQEKAGSVCVKKLKSNKKQKETSKTLVHFNELNDWS